MNVVITPGTGASSVAAEVIATLNYQQVKIIDGTVSSTTPLKVNSDGTIGASIIGAVPVTGSFNLTSPSILVAFAPAASLVSGVTSIISSTSITAVIPAAPGAQRNYITQITATNAAATGAFVDIRDGTTVIFSGYAAGSGGGFAASFPVPIRQSSVSAVVDMQTSAQASVKVAISGFTAA